MAWESVKAVCALWQKLYLKKVLTVSNGMNKRMNTDYGENDDDGKYIIHNAQVDETAEWFGLNS